MFSFKLSSSRAVLYAKVDSEIHAFTPNTDEYALSLSRYIMGHKLKVQTEISYEDKKYFSETQQQAGMFVFK
jgi:hypothetical protein